MGPCALHTSGSTSVCDAPRVVVVIPAYNAARFLPDAVNSVLRQTYSDFEIVIVDDGSTDDTLAIARAIADPRIRVMTQENLGLAAARNRGLWASQAEYVAFLDSDDLLLPDKLALHVAALDAHPDIGLVASGWEYIDADGESLGEERPWASTGVQPTLESILIHGLAAVHAVLVRRAWIENIRGFDPRFRMAEDMDFWFRLGAAGCHMAWVPAIVCQYRIHGLNMSRSVDKHYRAVRTALENLFERVDLPKGVRELRESTFAYVSLAQAGRLYAIAELEDARHCLQQALELDPGLCANGGRRVAEAVIAWERSVWAIESGSLVQTVLDNLPSCPALLGSFPRTVKALRDRAGFYDAFDRGDSSEVRRRWVSIAARDIRWLLNRGSWSILLQACRLWPVRRARQLAAKGV